MKFIEIDLLQKIRSGNSSNVLQYRFVIT